MARELRLALLRECVESFSDVFILEIGNDAKEFHLQAGVQINLRPLIQRLNDWSSAKISVRALNLIANRTQRLTRVHIAQFDSARQKIIDAIEDVPATG